MGQAIQPSLLMQTWEKNDTLRSEWNFDTIKSSASAMGSFKSMAKDLMVMPMPPGMEEDPQYISDDDEGLTPIEEDESFDTAAAVRGSDSYIHSRSTGIGISALAAHSTMRITPIPGGEDVPGLIASEDNSSPETSAEGPGTPPAVLDSHLNAALGAPPAYQSGSLRSSKRSSYAERNRVQGTMLREADVGTGVDTLRPVKRVDAAGSLRLSAEFLGVGANRRDSGSAPNSPTSPQKEGSSGRRTASESAKAGAAMINDIVVPTLQNVRVLVHRCLLRKLSYIYRPSEMTWTPEKSRR